MTHHPALLNALYRYMPLVGGALAVGAAVLYALDREWSPALIAVTAALWAFILAAHRCPAAPAPERGRVSVAFVGGPLDGAEVPLPPVEGLPEMQGIEIEAGGTRYRVAAVEHTHYTAEAIR